MKTKKISEEKAKTSRAKLLNSFSYYQLGVNTILRFMFRSLLHSLLRVRFSYGPNKLKIGNRIYKNILARD